MNKRDEILESVEEAKFFSKSTDDALMGYVNRAGSDRYVLYDRDKLEKLMGTALHFCNQEKILYFTKATLDEIIAVDEELLIADGYNDAIIGYAETHEGEKMVLYDSDKCIAVLQKDFEKETKERNPEKTQEAIDQETYQDAVEYFEYNTIGAYVGDKTPAFAVLIKEEKE